MGNLYREGNVLVKSNSDTLSSRLFLSENFLMNLCHVSYSLPAFKKCPIAMSPVHN